jgi:hypothetical protein
LNIRGWFEIPKRYYQRNKELVEACDLLHAFLSQEDGFTGGTRFRIEYAVRLGIPVQIHLEGEDLIPFISIPFSLSKGKRILLGMGEVFPYDEPSRRRGG